MNYKKIIKTIYKNNNYRTTLVTFSIFPELARIWWYFAKKYTNHEIIRTVIVDSSGEMNSRDFDGASLVNFPNYHHGKKMDIFIRHIIQTPYVLFCDDDTFIINSQLEYYGYNILKNPKTVVCSFNPRSFKTKICGKSYQLIGGSCIMINTALIKKLNISLEEKKCSFPYWTSVPFELFDTGDYLSFKLHEQKHSIRCRAAEQKPHFIFNFCEGISVAYQWYLIFKKEPFRIKRILQLKESPIRYAYKGLFGRYMVGKIYKRFFHALYNSGRILSKIEFNKWLQYLKPNKIVYNKVKNESNRIERDIIAFIRRYK